MSVLKKVFDTGLSAIGLLFSFPVMLLIALFVYLDSPGPVIFSQKRLGKNGKPFLMHKFRKFPVDWGTKGPGVTTSGDVRMTRVGRVLERTKLDELPQLWNIFRGEMSFVGPRPESMKYESLFKEEYKAVLDFTPGVFGPNQLVYRNESEMYPNDIDPEEYYRTELFPKKAKADIEYSLESTFISDVCWILRGTWGTISGIVNWHKFFNRYFLVLLIDFILIELAWICAHWFRFGFSVNDNNLSVFLTGCWLLPLIILPVMLLGGCYRHPVRYFSLSDVLRLIFVVSSAWILSILVVIGFFYRNISFAVVLLGLILLLTFLILPRVWRRERWLLQHTSNNQNLRRLLIYGADVKGNALAKFLSQAYPDILVVGYIDDDQELRGRFLNGYKVFGSWRDINVIQDKLKFSELWISGADVTAEDSAIQNWANENNVNYISLDKITAFASLDQ